MCVWGKELRQAFQEAIIRGTPFTVLDIRDRLQNLASSLSVDHQTVKHELLTLMEQGRPEGWALTTIPVVDVDGTPRTVWQFAPVNLLGNADQMMKAQRSKIERPSIIRRILAMIQR